MTEAFIDSMSLGRARSSARIMCATMSWFQPEVGGHNPLLAGAVGYSAATATKRNTPGVLIGGLT
jgi:hypothetical protein